MEILGASVHGEAAEHNACVVWGEGERLTMRDKGKFWLCSLVVGYVTLDKGFEL